MHFLLFIASIFPALICIVSGDSSALIFTPPKLDVPFRKGEANFTVKLSKKPSGHAKVYFTVENMQFNKCMLEFNDENWDKAQSLSLVTLPYFTEADTNRELTAKFKIAASKDKDLNKKEATLNITRSAGKGVLCEATGDPHYLSFDGRRFDVQDLGVFTLVTSDFLEVQFITKRWVNQNYVNEAVAIQYGECVHVYDAAKGLSCSGCTGKHGIIVESTKDSNSVHLKYPEGSEVKLWRRFASMHYVDVSVQLAGHAVDRVSGICGKFLEKPDLTTFYDKKDEKTKDVNAMIKSFKLKLEDSLFHCALKHSCTPLVGRAPTRNCVIPEIKDVEPDSNGYEVEKLPGYTIVKPPEYEEAPAIVKPSKPDPPNTVPNPEFLKKCTEACNSVMNIPEANKLVSPTPFINNCVDDCRLSLTLEFVDGHKNTYLAKVRLISSSVLKDPAYVDALEAKKEAKAAIVDLGLGTAKCPPGCEKHGKCQAGGCVCQGGWTGIACEISLDEYTVEVPATDGVPVKKQPPKVEKIPTDGAQAILNNNSGGAGEKGEEEETKEEEEEEEE